MLFTPLVPAAALLASLVPTTAAAPATLAKLPGLGVSIPLSNGKQGVPITKEDGTVNLVSLKRQLTLVRAKYQFTITQYLRNTGEMLGEILEDAKDSMHNASSTSHTRQKRQSEAIYNYGNDLLWAGQVGVGTPAQEFNIMFDTGSSDFWIPSADVTCMGCSGNRYDPTLSTTSKRKNGHFAIAYGDGSSSSGPIYTDVVQIGEFVDDAGWFSAVDQMSDSFADEPEDGIMGMGYASISNIRSRRQSEATSRPFGMRLAKTVDGDSELYLGGPNTQFYKGNFEFHPVRKHAYYNISGQVQLNGQDVFWSPRTTLIIASVPEAADFWSKVPGAAPYDEAEGYYTFPCSRPPAVSFTFDKGKRWPVRAVDMNLGRVSYKAKLCVGAIAGVDVGLGQNTWILGGTFMKNVYTLFDPADSHTVGFAQLA